MKKVFYAVFDTNVLVSGLLSGRKDSPTVALLDLVLGGVIVLLYNDDIIKEYEDVLHRDKFSFDDDRVDAVMALVRMGLELTATPTEGFFPDPDDRVFYEVSLSKKGAYMVTGNTRHFPRTPLVVTPAEMMGIINNSRGIKRE